MVELFAINSNLGNDTTPDPVQQTWFKSAASESNATYKLVYFHHPPYLVVLLWITSRYSTALHDPLAPWMRWPFQSWGATIVMSGHEHIYERIVTTDDFMYIVNGLGGN